MCCVFNKQCDFPIFLICQLLPEKTPLSGPGTLKTRAGRKRRRDDARTAGDKEMESVENEYRSKWKRCGNGCLENVI